MPKDEWLSARQRDIAERIARLESRVGYLRGKTRDPNTVSSWKWLPGAQEKIQQCRRLAEAQRAAEWALVAEQLAAKVGLEEPPDHERQNRKLARPKKLKRKHAGKVQRRKPSDRASTILSTKAVSKSASSAISLRDASAGVVSRQSTDQLLDMIRDLERQVDPEIDRVLHGLAQDSDGIPRIAED